MKHFFPLILLLFTVAAHAQKPDETPIDTIVQIDGREVARAVDRQNTTTALRSGRAVETE
mgnify:CR=1 FL=1